MTFSISDGQEQEPDNSDTEDKMDGYKYNATEKAYINGAITRKQMKKILNPQKHPKKE